MTIISGHSKPLLTVHKGNEPVLVAAIHAGHGLRSEIKNILKLDEAARLREEDPFTDAWICIADNFIIPQRSRFEVDLNRERDKAVYREPEDAWGLDIWQSPPDDEAVRHSLEEYDLFYQQLEQLLNEMRQAYGRFAIYDLHSYNYRRLGPDTPPADPEYNPEINVGTGTMDRDFWHPVVEAFIQQLKTFDFPGHTLDVRENIKFQGGQFPRWVHQHYPQAACVLSIEVKKFFMDEWSGLGDPVMVQAIRQALASTLPAVKKALQSMDKEA